MNGIGMSGVIDRKDFPWAFPGLGVHPGRPRVSNDMANIVDILHGRNA